MKLKIFIIQLLLQVAFHGQAQEIFGTITDMRKEPIVNATVRVQQAGIPKGVGVSDFDGNFVVKPLDPGRYEVIVSYEGKQTATYTGITVEPNGKTIFNATMENLLTDKAIIAPHGKRLTDPKPNGAPGVVTKDSIRKMGGPTTTDLVSMQPGVYQKRRGDVVYEGPRSSGTTYVIDGIQVQDAKPVKKQHRFHLWPFGRRH